jgi:hypothetical protein
MGQQELVWWGHGVTGGWISLDVYEPALETSFGAAALLQ